MAALVRFCHCEKEGEHVKDGDEGARARPVSFRHHPTLRRLEDGILLQRLQNDFDIHKQFHMQKSTEHGRYALGDVGSMLLTRR